MSIIFSLFIGFCVARLSDKYHFLKIVGHDRFVLATAMAGALVGFTMANVYIGVAATALSIWGILGAPIMSLLFIIILQEGREMVA